MGSGPNTGLGELHIPDLQPGSSIMPGKVNPVIPEAVLMVVRPRDRQRRDDRLGRRLRHRSSSTSRSRSWAPRCSSRSACSPTRARLLADKTIDGLEANVERARALAESSPSIVTPLNKLIGYEAAAKIAKHAVAKGITVREAVIDLGFVERGEVTLEQLDSALDVLSMTHPG